MRPITAFSLAALLLGSANVYALTGQQFYDKCVDTYKAPEQETAREAVGRALNAGSCSGYLGGVINGVNLVGNMLGQQKIIKKNFICLPQGKQAQELLQQALDYIKANPKMAEVPAQLSIYNVMAASYPCQEAPTPDLPKE